MRVQKGHLRVAHERCLSCASRSNESAAQDVGQGTEYDPQALLQRILTQLAQEQGWQVLSVRHPRLPFLLLHIFTSERDRMEAEWRQQLTDNIVLFACLISVL